MTSRRRFLQGSCGTAALLGSLGIPRLASGAVSPTDRKFLFVFATGGWVVCRAFSMGQYDPDIDTESDAVHSQVSNIPFVDHEDRPSVRRYFERHHASTLVLNGLLVQSIDHETCKAITMTGSGGVSSSDWPTMIASDQVDRYTAPYLVLNGPSFPGPLTSAVARTGLNGQLDSLLTGEALLRGDQPVDPPSLSAERIMDEYMVGRADARRLVATGSLDASLAEAFYQATVRGVELKDFTTEMSFAEANGRRDEMDTAVQALQTGLSRCVQVSGNVDWDTHADDPKQSGFFEGLFDDLDYLVDLLRATPGTSAPSLYEETIVVVLSEMARQPKLNAYLGRDHWPYTSAMLIGEGITTDRVVGAYDETLSGEFIGHATGDLDPDGVPLAMREVGATLLHLADMDPEETIGASPIPGILAG